MFKTCIFIASVALLASTRTAASAAATSVYVATTGSDSNDGTSPASAFATLQRAQQAVAVLRSTGSVVVSIAAGTYFLNATLSIAAADGGTAANSVSYVGAGQGATIISAGRTETNWVNVMGDIYAAPAPRFVRQLWSNNDGGPRRSLARTPILTYKSFNYTSGVLIAQPGTLPSWVGTQPPPWQVLIYHAWTSSLNEAKSYDAATNTLILQGTPGDPYFSASGDRFAILNSGQSLEAGTFNSSDAEIFYRLATGETADSLPRLIFESLPVAIQFAGNASAPVTNVHFANLTIAHTAASLESTCLASGCGDQSGSSLPYAAVMMDYATDVSFASVEIRGTGQYALWARRACRNVSIARLWAHDLGAGGVRIGMPASGAADPASLTRGVTVTDSLIEDGGHIVEAGVGVFMQQAAENNIVHNEIRNLKYTGVSLGWTWGYAATSTEGTNVSFNHIHHIGQGVLSDMGAVYNLGRSPGTTIANNVAHDVSAFGYGGWGLYTDEGSSNVTLRSNIVYRTKSAGFHQHYGTDNLFENNVIAFPAPADDACASLGDGCDLAGVRSSQHGPGGGAGMNSSFTFRRNIVLLGSANSTLTFTTIDAAFANCTLDHNTYWSAAVAPGKLSWPPTSHPTSWQQWQAEGKDAASIVADPLFADAAGYNFTLLAGSPALSLGFEQIDVSQVGPRPQ